MRKTRTSVAAKAGKARADGHAAAEPVQPARGTRQRTPLVRRAIIDAAANLFAERGFAGTNLRDVADVLGISRPGLYYHFASKEKLLQAMMEEVTVAGVQQFRETIWTADVSPETVLRQAVETSAAWMLDNYVMFRVLDRSEAEMTPELRKVNDRWKREMLEHFTDIVTRGIADGKFRPVDPHVAALTIFGMRNWIAWWFKPEGRLSKAEIARVVADMSVGSILRTDSHRPRSERVGDALRILKEDVEHLSQLLTDGKSEGMAPA